MNRQQIRDCFGRSYIVQTTSQAGGFSSIKSEFFSDRVQARRFIQNLGTPDNFWQKIYSTEFSGFYSINNQQLFDKIAELLVKGKIRIYRIEMASSLEHPPEKRTLLDSDKNKYIFLPASTLLVNSPKEIKTFNTVQEANAFITELSADNEKIKGISEEIGVDIKARKGNESDEYVSELASMLVKGTIVVAIDRYASPPVPDKYEKDDEVVSDKEAGLGPPPDEFKEITIDLEDEFEKKLAAHFSLFNGLEYTIKSDLGDEKKGIIENGKIHIDKIKMNRNYQLKIKKLPAFMDM